MALTIETKKINELVTLPLGGGVDWTVVERDGIPYKYRTASMPTPQIFGAKGDGSTDDSAAIKSWLEHLIANNLAGYIPAGDYVIATAVQVSSSGNRFSIGGAGIGLSRFIVPSANTTGGILITSSSRSDQVHMHDFAVIAQGQGGNGLQFVQPEGGAQHQRSIICERLALRGENGASDWFSTFLNLSGTWRPLVVGCIIDGPWIGVGLTNGSNRYAANAGINLQGAYDPSIDHCHIWGVATGIASNVYTGAITSFADQGGGVVRVTVSNGPHPFSTGFGITITGTSNYDGAYTVTNVSSTQFDITATFVATETGSAYITQGAEAFRLTNTIINGVRTALNYVRPIGREPIIWIDNCHINFRDDGFKIDGAKLVTIRGCHPYNEDTGDEYSGDAHDINLVNATEFIITGNHFHFDGATDRLNVFVQSAASGAGQRGIIAHNIFNSAAEYAVWLSSGCEDVIVGPNLYTGTYGSGSINDVSSNAQILDGKSETTGTWTPSLSFGGGSVGMTYSTRTGSYKIVGGLLHYKIEITLTAKGTSTGNVEISLPASLPGPLVVQANGGAGALCLYSGMASITSPVARPLSASALRLTNQGASAVTNLTASNFTDTSSFVLTGFAQLG